MYYHVLLIGLLIVITEVLGVGALLSYVDLIIYDFNGSAFTESTTNKTLMIPTFLFVLEN